MKYYFPPILSKILSDYNLQGPLSTWMGTVSKFDQN